MRYNGRAADDIALDLGPVTEREHRLYRGHELVPSHNGEGVAGAAGRVLGWSRGVIDLFGGVAAWPPCRRIEDNQVVRDGGRGAVPRRGVRWAPGEAQVCRVRLGGQGGVGLL